MQIPVLLALPSQEPLQESAMAAQEGRAPAFPITRAAFPKNFRLDERFSAVPIGTGRLGQSAAALHPGATANFAVRGHVEAADPTDIPTQVDGKPVFADPKIQAFQPAPMTCGGTAPVGAIADVCAKLGVAQLAAKNLDGTNVAICIMDTGINRAHVQSKLGRPVRLDAANSWTPAGSTILPGNHPVDHGSMCAFDALSIAPNATLLDYPILSSNAPGGSTMGGTLSTALVAFAQLLAGWGVAFAPGGIPQYSALVVSNSWGMFHPSWDFPAGHPGRYCDNPNHPFSIVVAALAATGADIIFAAGNCGSQCADGRCNGRTTGAIMGASTYQDILSIAGCDTNDRRVGYSSQGPSIANMFQQKPDVASYTHFLGSEAFGAGSPDSGTSAACPITAGCVAALRTRLSRAMTPPANLFAQLRGTATQVGLPGWNGDYGYGIIRPVAAATSLGL